MFRVQQYGLLIFVVTLLFLLYFKCTVECSFFCSLFQINIKFKVFIMNSKYFSLNYESLWKFNFFF